MTKLLEKAIAAMRRLSDDAQDSVAREVLARIEEEADWDKLAASPASRSWLEKTARAAIEEHEKGELLPFDPSNRPESCGL
jgi:hypothetical protein